MSRQRVNRFTDVKLNDGDVISVRVEKKRGGGRGRMTVIVNYDTDEVAGVQVETVLPEADDLSGLKQAG